MGKRVHSEEETRRRPNWLSLRALRHSVRRPVADESAAADLIGCHALPDGPLCECSPPAVGGNHHLRVRVRARRVWPARRVQGAGLAGTGPMHGARSAGRPHPPHDRNRQGQGRRSPPQGLAPPPIGPLRSPPTTNRASQRTGAHAGIPPAPSPDEPPAAPAAAPGRPFLLPGSDLGHQWRPALLLAASQACAPYCVTRMSSMMKLTSSPSS